MQINPVAQLDFITTKAIFDLFNSHPVLKQLPFYLGLLPYEVYVLPGMFVAILQVIWFSAFNPIQFHLFPHFFAYSLFQFLKGTVGRERPGCKHPSLSGSIDPSHCKNKVRFMSFPSGHTGVAFSLAAALYSEMTFSNDPRFFDVKIKNPKHRKIIKYCGLFVASAISIHRVAKGYHYVGDVLSGALLGSTLGFISWSVLQQLNNKIHKLCEYEDNKDKKECQAEILGIKMITEDKHLKILELIAKIALTIPVILLFLKFIVKDFWKLATIQH